MAIRLLFIVAINILLVLLAYFFRKKKQMGGLMLMACSTMLVLSSIEFLYRFRLMNDSYYVGDLSRHLYISDSLLGYKMSNAGKYKAIKKIRDQTTFNETYTIFGDTSETPFPFNHRVGYHDTSSTEIVFLGCSFTFGEGLADSVTLPYLTGMLMHRKTINNACIGYGVNHVYQLFQSKYSTQNNNKRIFVYSFLYDHILRANGVYHWNMRGPFFTLNNDSLVYSGPLEKSIKNDRKYTHYLSGFSTFTFIKDMLNNIATKNHVGNLQQADYDRCFVMIEKMAANIERSGGKLVLLDWDRGNWANSTIDNFPFHMIEERLENLNAHHIELIRISSILDYTDTSYFIPNDGHPSEKANRKIALALKTYLEKES